MHCGCQASEAAAQAQHNLDGEAPDGTVTLGRISPGKGGVTQRDVRIASVSAIVGFFFSSRRRHTRWNCDWSSDVCSSDLQVAQQHAQHERAFGIHVVRAERRERHATPLVDLQILVVLVEVVVVLGVGAELRPPRSEERRVGKECRYRWSACPYTKKTTRTC